MSMTSHRKHHGSGSGPELQRLLHRRPRHRMRRRVQRCYLSMRGMGFGWLVGVESGGQRRSKRVEGGRT